MLVIGSLCALVGLGLLAGAGVAGWVNYQQRDGRYFITPSERLLGEFLRADSPRLDLMTGRRRRTTAFRSDIAGSVLLRGSSTDPGKEIFIGIAPRADVAAYLAGVRRTEIVDVRFDPFRARYREVTGSQDPVQSGAADLLGRDCHRPGGTGTDMGPALRDPGQWWS